MARAVNKRYYIVLTGDAETLTDSAEETKDNGVMATLNLLNKTGYNKLILAQEDTICFQNIEE